MIFQFWGATNEEIHSSVVGDSLCADATLIATRSITIKAPPQDVFPWIRQMGFGRAGWYSYDWLDNLGRKSATRVHEEWQSVESGDKVPSGPISFTAAIVDAPPFFFRPVLPQFLSNKVGDPSDCVNPRKLLRHHFRICHTLQQQCHVIDA